MKKRFLSVLTALALCLTLLPTAALAADITRPSTGETETIGEVTGNGTIQSSQSVSKLDFRFDPPSSVTEYKITDGGTAKWEPGNGSTPNKLTLNGVTMTGDSYVVGVPANTEIILSGENKITSTNGSAICPQNGALKINASGSL